MKGRLNGLFKRLNVLLVKELRDLARDRKVFYAAILLPALLFPILLSFSGKLITPQDEPAFGLRVGITAHGEFVDALVSEAKWANWAAGGDEDSIRTGELDAVLLADYSNGRLLNYRVLYDKSTGHSAMAAQRLQETFEIVKDRMRQNAIATMHTPSDLVPPAQLELLDLAAFVHSGNPTSSNFLPSMLVLMMLAAAAFAAIDLFPGERERGTLETLLVQPIRAEEVLFGKYLAVFATGYVAVLANLMGVALASSLDASPLKIPLSFTSIFGAALIALPTSALISAVLVRTVSRASSVREAQHYLMPLTLVSMVPALLAAAPELEFNSFTASIPLAGPALAFREIALGHVHWLPLVVMLLTTLLYSSLILAGSLRYLAHEEAILSSGSSEADDSGSRAIAVALFAILGTFVSAPFLRSASPLAAIALPLVVFTALPPLLLGRSVGLDIKLKALTLPLRQKTRVRSWLLALSTGLGIALLVTGLASVQREFLPPPAAFSEAGTKLLAGLPSLPVALLVLALLPALAEELLYRRFVLHGLRTKLDRNRAILATAALFALHHLSVYRFLPSFVAGVVLGHLVLRSHRFWLAPVAHATSNGLMILLAHSASPLYAGEISKFFGDPNLALWRIALGTALVIGTPWLLERRSLWNPNTQNSAA